MILILLILALSFNTACIVYEKPSREISSNEIIDKIAKGDLIDYDDVTINGDLNLSKINLPLTHITKSSFEFGLSQLSENARIVVSPIIITNSKINGSINFNGTIFKNSTNFFNTRIRGESYFIDTQFNGYTNFAMMKFEKDTYFDGASFVAYADFGKSQFVKNASFKYAQFRGDLDIENAIFYKNLYFNDSEFGRYVDFINTVFSNYVSFEGCNFRGDVGFESCSFLQDINFSRSKFDRYVYFDNAIIKGKINLINTKLFLFQIEWNIIKDHILYDGPTYIQLIRNFKELEQFQDADDCYYQYRLEKQSLEHFGLSKLIDIFALLSCGYGVRLSYNVFSAIYVMIIFSIYFALKEGVLNLRGKLFRAKIIETIFFSAMILLSLPADWYPFGDKKYNKYKKFNLYPIIIERLIGWVLMLILIGVLTRIMIRY